MAGRKSFIRYYPSRHGYFTTYLGKTYTLAIGPDDGPNGPTFEKAIEAFKIVIRNAGAVLVRDENRIDTIVERYLQWLEVRRKKSTVNMRRSFLLPFCRFSDQGSKPFGELRISDLLPHHVERYCDYMRQPRWSPHQKKMMQWTGGSSRTFLDCLMGALNWAAGPKQKLITHNPIQGIEKPPIKSRGAEFLVPPEIHQKALAAAKEDFRQLLIVLQNTGCRPGELFMAEARHFDVQLGAIIFRGDAHLQEGEKSHKTSGKNKDRLIILTGDALLLVKELVRKYPTGNLFRISRKTGGAGELPWTSQAAWRRVRTIRRKTGLPRTFSLYSYRHQYASAWLKAGRSIEDLAVLLGNCPDVIRRHYGHICDDTDRLRNIAEAFSLSLPQ